MRQRTCFVGAGLTFPARQHRGRTPWGLNAKQKPLPVELFVEHDHLVVAHSQMQHGAHRERSVSGFNDSNLASLGFAEQDLLTPHVLDVLQRDGSPLSSMVRFSGLIAKVIRLPPTFP